MLTYRFQGRLLGSLLQNLFNIQQGRYRAAVLACNLITDRWLHAEKNQAPNNAWRGWALAVLGGGTGAGGCYLNK